MKFAYTLRQLQSIGERTLDAVQLWKLRQKRGLVLGDNVQVQGAPFIQIATGATIKIGDNVVLNSRGRGYHVAMYAPIKLLADQPRAVISIGSNTRIHGSCCHAYNSITIGKNCLIAANTNIFDAHGHQLSFDDVSNRIRTISVAEAEPIIIGDNVWIGFNSIILPGTVIGDGSIVAAGGVVTKEVPSMCIAGGNPARILKRYE
jgi:acetyltransferase-like isoleucine patch superfamily enzyme